MTDNPSIIRLGVLYIFTMPFPPGSVNKLIPPDSLFDVEYELYPLTEQKCFMYKLELASHLPSLYTPEIPPQIFEVLDYIWAELTRRELVTGLRPDVIEGDPIKMLT